MRVRWTRSALANLSDLADYIAEDNPKAAGTMLERVASAIARLQAHPALGRAGRLPNTRELVIPTRPMSCPIVCKRTISRSSVSFMGRGAGQTISEALIVGFVMLNPEGMADIKVAIPFVPVATLLFTAALRRLPPAKSQECWRLSKKG